MFNPWFAFSLNAFQMGVEAQSVMALRLLRKVAAAAEAQAVAALAAMSGKQSHVVAGKALNVYRKRVRANRRRLSRR